MVKRYSRDEMTRIWSEESKFASWLEVEILALEGYAKHNKNITKSDIDKIKKVKININRILEIENEVKHDVIAFTRSLSEQLGPEKKWIHYGLTSTDVVDTAQSIRLKEANAIMMRELNNLISVLRIKAKKYKYTYQIGRTHGIHAEVTTFGYTFALWYDEMLRNIERFKHAAIQIEIAKISGAVGNYANIPLSVQDYVAKNLGLTSSKISTQVLQRDRHAEYLNTIALIGASLDKFAINLRHLQRTEVNEISESFAKNQKGSSAMPHKNNPIGLENISGLSRVLKGYAIAGMEDIPLWHERDISHSSVERIVLPDATILIDYMINRFTSILENMVVNEKKMMDNINLTNGVIFSQKVLLYVIEKNEISRERAYDLIQPIALRAYKNGDSFAKLLVEEKVLKEKEISKIFNLKDSISNIDDVYKRLKI